MEDWRIELERGAPDAAWDLFIHRYRRLLFAAIQHYARDYDDVMDVFARVCEALREDGLRRLRSYLDESEHRARFTTWLVVVVRNLTVDWFRHRDGRRRISGLGDGLSPLGRRIFQKVFLDRRSHVEAFELIRAEAPPGPSFREFLAELRATYQALGKDRRGQLMRYLGGPALPPEEPEEEHPDPAEWRERREWVRQVLGSLEPEERVAVELFVLEELPAAEIARVLGLPNAKAVYNRVYRTLEALRARLNRAGVRKEDL